MKVIVTGFAGTVGDAFTQYLLKAGHDVVGIDNNEWAVASYPDHPNLTKVLGDFSEYADSCDLLIHCAAYKHVDLLERCPSAAITNNIERTEYLYNNIEFGGLLYVSTDKSVEPCSEYGRSKHEAEEISRKAGGIVSRMGNILGSTGSVIPKWEACLKSREPLPVTDYRMRRWVIPADEAVLKIMKLIDKAKPGDTIVPDMGELVGLTEMITDFLLSHGEKKSYPVVEIGMRPGERVEEILTWPDEVSVHREKGVGQIYRKQTI